jgi:hypothetical protein
LALSVDLGARKSGRFDRRAHVLASGLECDRDLLGFAALALDQPFKAQLRQLRTAGCPRLDERGDDESAPMESLDSKLHGEGIHADLLGQRTKVDDAIRATPKVAQEGRIVLVAGGWCGAARAPGHQGEESSGQDSIGVGGASLSSTPSSDPAARRSCSGRRSSHAACSGSRT